MRFASALIVVSDIERSKIFYCGLLGQKIENDFGENVTFEGGFCIQQRKLWSEFISKDESEIIFKGNDAELYFEEDEFDRFLKKLESSGAELVHAPLEHGWGQRVVRFYDPDFHIVEVGESLEFVCKRLLSQGMSCEEVGEKTQMGVDFVNRLISEL